MDQRGAPLIKSKIKDQQAEINAIYSVQTLAALRQKGTIKKNHSFQDGRMLAQSHSRDHKNARPLIRLNSIERNRRQLSEQRQSSSQSSGVFVQNRKLRKQRSQDKNLKQLREWSPFSPRKITEIEKALKTLEGSSQNLKRRPLVYIKKKDKISKQERMDKLVKEIQQHQLPVDQVITHIRKVFSEKNNSEEQELLPTIAGQIVERNARTKENKRISFFGRRLAETARQLKKIQGQIKEVIVSFTKSVNSELQNVIKKSENINRKLSGRILSNPSQMTEIEEIWCLIEEAEETEQWLAVKDFSSKVKQLQLNFEQDPMPITNQRKNKMMLKLDSQLHYPTHNFKKHSGQFTPRPTSQSEPFTEVRYFNHQRSKSKDSCGSVISSVARGRHEEKEELKFGQKPERQAGKIKKQSMAVPADQYEESFPVSPSERQKKTENLQSNFKNLKIMISDMKGVLSQE